MKQYEYKTIVYNLQTGIQKQPSAYSDKILELLNEQGKEGWELCSEILVTVTAPKKEILLIFKRENVSK